MNVLLTLLTLLFGPVFMGSTIWTLVWAFQSRERRASVNWYELDKLVTWALVFTSLLYLIHAITNLAIDYFSTENDVQYAMLNRAFGTYWLSYWIMFWSYALFPQSLWFKKLRHSRVFRIIFAIWMLIIVDIGSLIILITSMHRDYIPSSWVIFYPNWIEYFYSISIFALLIGAIRLSSIAYQRIFRN